MAKIIIKRDGKVVHRESKTFERRPAAAAWIAKREEELQAPGAMSTAGKDDPTLRQAIERHELEVKRMGRTKAQVLRSIKDFDIATKRCSEIGSTHIVAFARELAKTRSPSTVASYMVFLSGVFEIARPAWGYPLDRQAMADAMIVAAKQGLTGRSNERNRRPTLEELEKLMSFFAARKDDSVPMVVLTAFAIFSTRRQGEIVRIQWSDLDEPHSRILVRDMKDPKGAAGNHTWVELPPEAMQVIKSMPRTSDEIFPFKGDTINVAWRNACRLLSIPNLKFHDLRHEGVSRLFEMGNTIPQVASVSGHRSWQNLQRYTHIRQTGDKYAGWKWLDRFKPQQP